MAVEGLPTLEDVKSWLGLDPGDDSDDVVLQESLDAAIDLADSVLEYPANEAGDAVYTPAIVKGIYLVTQRLASRRNSPEGVVGLSGVGGEFVGARVPSGDPDVLRLWGPYLTMVVA